MTVTEIIAAARVHADDQFEPYKWSPTSMLYFLNDTLNTIARETGYFIDSYTSSVSRITITAGTQDYALSANLLQILSARLISESTHLTQTTLYELRDSHANWRYSTKLIGTDISFTNSGTSDTINSTTTDLSVYDAGTDIVVSGSTSNNGLFTVTASTTTSLTLSTTDSLTTESAGDTVVISDPYTGTPTKFLTDYRTGYLTLYPCPDESGVLELETIRRSSSTLTGTETIGDVTATANVPDIRADFHYRLIDGMLYRAYLQSGEHTFNPNKSKIYYGLFRSLISDIKRDMTLLQGIGARCTPHSGTI